jgi:hypothetical protein
MASTRRDHTGGNYTKPFAKSLLTIDQFLEHVIGSQTLVATVANALSFRSFNLVTLGLVAMWALSPLGGQSALRLLHETNTTSTNHHSVFYANVDASSRLPIGGNNVDDFNRVNSVVSTSLMTASTLEWTPVDTWNHPKIPRVEELEQAENTNETHRTWYNLDRHANHSYASLTGVGVINLSPVGSTNFTIPYEYMYFDCDLSPANNITTYFDTEDGTNLTSTTALTQYKFLQTLDSAGRLESAGQFPPNLGASIAPARPQSSYRDFFFYTKNSEGSTFKPDALLYGSSQVGLSYYLFECSMKSVLVEANIVCEAASCGIERLRRLKVARKDRHGSGLPYDVVNNGMYSRFFIQYLANIGGENSIYQNNPVDAYINGLTPWSTVSEVSSLMKDWTQYINDSHKTWEMSYRLTRLMNTYWDASRWPKAMTLNDPWGKTSIHQTTGQPKSSMTMNQTDVSINSKSCETHTESVQGNRHATDSCLSCQRWMGSLPYHLLRCVTISRHLECVSVAPHHCARHLQSCLFLHAR